MKKVLTVQGHILGKYLSIDTLCPRIFYYIVNFYPTLPNILSTMFVLLGLYPLNLFEYIQLTDNTMLVRYKWHTSFTTSVSLPFMCTDLTFYVRYFRSIL